MSVNVNSYGVISFLIYFIGSGIEEIIEHIIKGVTLNNDLKDEEIVYDSSFIHYIRMIVLSMVFVVLFITVAVLISLWLIVSDTSSMIDIA